MSHYPILLTCAELLAPIELAQKTLVEVRERAPDSAHAALVRRGHFVLAVASVEVMISDVLSALLTAIPEKLPERTASVSRQQLIERPSHLLADQVEQYVRSLSYRALNDMLDEFAEQLGIDLASFTAADRERLQEIKESRNLLLHAGLRVNSSYLAKAGPHARASREGTSLEIDSHYLNASLVTLERLCESCHREIANHYGQFTKTRALRALWDYLFDSPLLRFEDCWGFSNDGETVYLKKTNFDHITSNGESVLLGTWLNHFGGPRYDHIKRLQMRLLDARNQQRLLWFLGVLRTFRLD